MPCTGCTTRSTPLRRRAKPERKRPPCRVGRNETAAAAQEWTVSFLVSIVFRFCSSSSAASSYFLPASGPGGYAETHYLHRNRSNTFTVGIIVLNFGTHGHRDATAILFFIYPYAYADDLNIINRRVNPLCTEPRQSPPSIICLRPS